MDRALSESIFCCPRKRADLFFLEERLPEVAVRVDFPALAEGVPEVFAAALCCFRVVVGFLEDSWLVEFWAPYAAGRQATTTASAQSVLTDAFRSRAST